MKKKTLFNFVIGEWAEKYPPSKNEDFALKLSSEEIREEINKFISADVDEITNFLKKNGYSIVRTENGKIKWLISNKERPH